MTVYKGQITYSDLCNMPANVRHCLYVKGVKKMSTDEGRKQVQGNQLQEELEQIGMV